ncbi:MAG: GatB/YqeY domain-containing protein [Candidatus Omnitrophica bacterium]|nr:GatB/YqeY domain-containing protein [Candidatus Omnitrophota bacterium]MCM8826748.1 GatB/YqeY domain-containing protein [Candidatus Omnitrophota bacterium]
MLEERIYEDYIKALKLRDKHKIDFLSFIRAEIKKLAIDSKKDRLCDEEVLGVLRKQRKRLQEAKDSISSSQRWDKIEELDKDIAILDDYLPKELSSEELEKIIEEVILEVNALTIKDMGKVMKEVMAKVGIKADTKKVSELVRAKLSKL